MRQDFTYNYYIFSLIDILFVSYYMCLVISYSFMLSTCIFKLPFYFLKCIKHRDFTVCVWYIVHLKSPWRFLLYLCLHLHPRTNCVCTRAVLFPYLFMHLIFLELCLRQVWGLSWRQIYPERMDLGLFHGGASKALLETKYLAWDNFLIHQGGLNQDNKLVWRQLVVKLLGVNLFFLSLPVGLKAAHGTPPCGLSVLCGRVLSNPPLY